MARWEPTAATARAPRPDPRIYRVAAHSPLAEKGNEIQRCEVLYEFMAALYSNGPDLLIRHVVVDPVLLIAYARSIWNRFSNG